MCIYSQAAALGKGERRSKFEETKGEIKRCFTMHSAVTKPIRKRTPILALLWITENRRRASSRIDY